MVKSYRTKHLEAQRKYQATYRERMRSDGWKQITVWLEPEAAKAVSNLKGMKLSDFINKVVLKSLPEQISTDKLTSEIKSQLTNKITSKSKLKRYMSTELEDEILQLRESGLTLEETSSRLADEGFMDATDKPYRTRTLSKAEDRARRRRS